MSDDLTLTDRESSAAIVHDLETAWNHGDGAAFADHFTPDADFVNIQAEHMQGRDVIASGHTAIFRTIYAGRTNQYSMEAARLIAPKSPLCMFGQC